MGPGFCCHQSNLIWTPFPLSMSCALSTHLDSCSALARILPHPFQRIPFSAWVDSLDKPFGFSTHLPGRVRKGPAQPPCFYRCSARRQPATITGDISSPIKAAKYGLVKDMLDLRHKWKDTGARLISFCTHVFGRILHC